MSGYMASCWRCLSDDHGVDTRVVAWSTEGSSDNAQFRDSVMHGINCRILNPEERENTEILEDFVRNWEPDVIVVAGWKVKTYNIMTENYASKGCKIVLCMDNPWEFRFQQYLAKYYFRSLFRRVNLIAVAGARSAMYASALGFRANQIFVGLYAWDARSFSDVSSSRNRKEAWPRAFMYSGRYEAEKGIETLLSAYEMYREIVEEPWPLKLCGQGSLRKHVESVPGAVDLGFKQPDELAEVMAECGVYILPSSYEPWGVALAEAMGGGMPAISTHACGAAIDLIRDSWNGYIVAPNCPRSLCEAMYRTHIAYTDLPEMGRRAALMAQPYSQKIWAYRWSRLLSGLTVRK